MSAKHARIGIATVCLVTLLHLPAGALSFGVLPSVTPDRSEAAPCAPPVDLTSTADTSPRAPCLVAPIDGGLWTGPEPTEPPAPPVVQPPATVENVRRSDTH
jgi:hypothetical protein